MNARVEERVGDWPTRRLSEGYRGLQDLADEEFSGVVEADGGPWLCMLNGNVVGVFDGRIEEFQAADGTVYEAPDPALPLLFAMLERGGTLEEQYYTKDTSISEADDTLSSGTFSGYIELSENVLSGDYYVLYYGGRSMSVGFVGSGNDRLITGEEAFQKADDEVGIYDVNSVDVEVVEIPETRSETTDEDAGSETPHPATEDPERGTASGGPAGSPPTEEEPGPATDAGEESPVAGGRSDPLAEPDDRTRETSPERPERDQDGNGDATPGERSRGSPTDTPDDTAGGTGDAGPSGEKSDDSTGTSPGVAPERASRDRLEGTAGDVEGADSTGEARADSTDASPEAPPGQDSPERRSSGRPEREASTDYSEAGRNVEDEQRPNTADDAGTEDGIGTRTGEEPPRDESEPRRSGEDAGSDRRGSTEPRRDERAGRRPDEGSGRREQGDPTGSRSGGDTRRETSRSEGSTGESHRDAHAPEESPDEPRRRNARSTEGRSGEEGRRDRPRGSDESGGSNRRREPAPDAGRRTGDSESREDRRGRDTRREREESTERLREQVRQHEAVIDRLRDRLSTVESDGESRSATVERLEREIDDLSDELGNLRRTVMRLDRTVERLESGGAQATGESSGSDIAAEPEATTGSSDAPARSDGVDLSVDEALAETTVLVRHASQGAATLASAHDGDADAEAVNDNLQLNAHTSFDDSQATVEGQPYREFLEQRLEYRFFEWLVRELIYEIRETGNAEHLENLYDAIPRIDRAEFRGSVELDSPEDQEAERVEFDLVVRDARDRPLVVSNFHDSREPATKDMVDELLQESKGVSLGPGLESGFLVTTSYFEGRARDTAEEETGGSLLSRSSKKSYVRLSRKRGFHLCLVAVSDGAFHLKVPEL